MSARVATHEDVALARVQRPSRLSYDLLVEGTVQSFGTVVVDGTVHGDIVGTTVCVDENGVVSGLIRGEVVAIGGTLNGDVECKSLSVTASGRLIGNVCYEKIDVEVGAVLAGRLNHKSFMSNQTDSGGSLRDQDSN